jgi:hypothetical protein
MIVMPEGTTVRRPSIVKLTILLAIVHFLSTAPNLQTWKHRPHLMHRT